MKNFSYILNIKFVDVDIDVNNVKSYATFHDDDNHHYTNYPFCEGILEEDKVNETNLYHHKNPELFLFPLSEFHHNHHHQLHENYIIFFLINRKELHHNKNHKIKY